MAKSQIVNIIANKFSLSREWLIQFKAQDLEEMLEKLEKELG